MITSSTISPVDVTKNLKEATISRTIAARSSIFELRNSCNDTVSSSGGNIVQDVKNMKAKKQKDFATILSESRSISDQLEKEKFLWNQKCYSDDVQFKKQKLDNEIKKSENEILIKEMELKAQAELQEKMFNLQAIKDTRMELIKLGKTTAEIKEILAEMFEN
jgi:hypothetical protein